jgi:hypothetical protein
VRTGRSIVAVSDSLYRLRDTGRVSVDGGWFQQVST